MPTSLLAQFVWLPIDTWIVVVGALSGMSCALVGVWLVLRKQSMMGDAISHAVLPGLAAAFLLTGSRDSLVMLAGAGAAGVLTAVFTERIRSAGKVDEGASMGVVFTVLFAIGLILIRKGADRVDLDPDCVLYGAIELTPLDMRSWLGLSAPRAVWIAAGMLLFNALFVAALYKELRIAAFDPALATTLGLHAAAVHYLLMAVVAVTTVVAFENVGSILVIAMLIVPPAAARLLTDRLGPLLLLSLLIAALSAALGHLAAVRAPAWFGFAGVSVSTAGMMGVAAGALFVLALLAGPRHGIISQLVHRTALSLRILREDLLGLLYRLEELGDAGSVAATPHLLGTGVGGSPTLRRLALHALVRRGLVRRERAGYRLTRAGRLAAQELVRSHRLWEAYLQRHLQVPPDHLHGTAARLEHVGDPVMTRRLAAALGNPDHDPHGRQIPRE